MADLKQALIWLSEGKKIKVNKWHGDIFIHLGNGVQFEDGTTCILDEYCNHDDWELYIPKPQYNPDEVSLKNKLIDMEDYVVWDKIGHRSVAYWSSADQCFYDIYHQFAFALDVVEWAPIPQRKKNEN